MQVIVVGAGAWGLPTATRLAEERHAVTLIDRWGPGNKLSSSPGPSRIWRALDHRPDRVELSVLALESLQRSQRLSETKLFTESGMLWRHEASNEAVAAGLEAAGVAFKRVAATNVGEYFPGFKPSAVAAIWSPVAGTLLADRVLHAELARFKKAGGSLLVGEHIVSVHPDEAKPSVTTREGHEYSADVIVLAPGMGAKALLDPLVARPLPFVTRLEQVVHFGAPEKLKLTDTLPCIFDGATETEPGMYGMATPGVGYKFGFDIPIREFDLSDLDRTPSSERIEFTAARVARDFNIPTTVVDAQVCNWTDSADGEFVFDRLPGNIVVGAGDSGEGFKFTSLVGEVLADLAVGRTPKINLQQFNIARFALNPSLKPDNSGASFSHRRFGE